MRLFKPFFILFLALSLGFYALEAAQYPPVNQYNPYYQNTYQQPATTQQRVIKKPVKKRVKRIKRRVKKSVEEAADKVAKNPNESKGYHEFLDMKGFYYAGISVGQTTLSRHVELNSNVIQDGDGNYLDLIRSDDGSVIGPADGTTYTFNQNYNYTRLALVGGFQDQKTGDFYQFSFYTNDLVEDVLFSVGYSYKKFGYQYLYGMTPYMRIDGGFGHTDTENGLPTNYTLGLGTGMYKNYEGFHLRGGIGYQKRFWLNLDKENGTEKWEDTELTFRIGAFYLF